MDVLYVRIRLRTHQPTARFATSARFERVTLWSAVPTRRDRRFGRQSSSKSGAKKRAGTKNSGDEEGGDRSPHSKGDAILAVHFVALIPNYG